MPTQIINSELYPIDRLYSASGKAWLEEVHAALEGDGSCTLPNFVAPAVLQQMAAQAQSITHLAYAGPTEVAPYFFNYRLGEGEDLPQSHAIRNGSQ